jgi:hypothetical protein
VESSNASKVQSRIGGLAPYSSVGVLISPFGRRMGPRQHRRFPRERTHSPERGIQPESRVWLRRTKAPHRWDKCRRSFPPYWRSDARETAWQPWHLSKQKQSKQELALSLPLETPIVTASLRPLCGAIETARIALSPEYIRTKEGVDTCDIVATIILHFVGE